MFSMTSRGDFAETEKFLRKAASMKAPSSLHKIGQAGVTALSNATPKNTGKTASSWRYEITSTGNGFSIDFLNSNINDNVNIAVILQYGHGTGTGGYVAGRDYINPAIQPVFDRLADEAWKEVSK